MVYTKEQIKERFNTLSPTLRTAMGSEAGAERIKAIADGAGFSPRSRRGLVSVIGYVMLGFVKMRDFVDELEKEAQIDHETAVKVAKQVHQQIFMPIRDEMLNTYGGTFEMNMDGGAPVPQAPRMTQPVQPIINNEASISQNQARTAPGPQSVEKQIPVPQAPKSIPVQVAQPVVEHKAPEVPEAQQFVPPQTPSAAPVQDEVQSQEEVDGITFIPDNLPGAETIDDDESAAQEIDRSALLQDIEHSVEERNAVDKKSKPTDGDVAPKNFMEERMNVPVQTAVHDVPRAAEKSPTPADYAVGDPYREPIN